VGKVDPADNAHDAGDPRRQPVRDRAPLTRGFLRRADDRSDAAADTARFREWMYSFVQRCTRAGISLMMIVEVPDLFQLRRVSDEGMSHLADNVVLVQYVQEGPELLRALTVLKTRASITVRWSVATRSPRRASCWGMS
jgi:hypothetical protein